MNAARRMQQKARRRMAGCHGLRDHKKVRDPKHPGKLINVRCLICRPMP